LLAKNEKGETAWDIAFGITDGRLTDEIFTDSDIADKEMLQKLWMWAKEVKLERKEFKNR
jgi:hypothetical protein